MSADLDDENLDIFEKSNANSARLKGLCIKIAPRLRLHQFSALITP
jgi:hypothetical protein